jgi:hypothetical protein
MSQAFGPEPELVCSLCGQPDAHAVGDELLCAGCCHVRGSCGAVPESEGECETQIDPADFPPK